MIVPLNLVSKVSSYFRIKKCIAVDAHVDMIGVILLTSQHLVYKIFHPCYKMKLIVVCVFDSFAISFSLIAYPKLFINMQAAGALSIKIGEYLFCFM